MKKRQRLKIEVSLITKLSLWIHEKREYVLTKQEAKLYKQNRYTYNYISRVTLAELKAEGKL